MGLVQTVGKSAAIAGTSTLTRNAINRRQVGKNVEAYAEAVDQVAAQEVQAQTVQDPTYYAAETDQKDVIEKLEKLGELYKEGILTEEEFAAQKSILLNS